MPPREQCFVGVPLLGRSMPLELTTVIWVRAGGELALDGCHVGRGAMLSVGPQARLSVGTGSIIGQTSRLFAMDGIEIGRDVSISYGVTIADDDGHGFGPPPYSAPIRIEDGAWVCAGATILKGVTIGAGSVVAAGAVVTRSCPPRTLVAGVPARVIRTDLPPRSEYPAGYRDARAAPAVTAMPHGPAREPALRGEAESGLA